MTFAIPQLALPVIDTTAARRVLDQTIAALLWAIAITYTAGRLTRSLFEWARPGLARLTRWLSDLLMEPPAQPLSPKTRAHPADLAGACLVLKVQGHTQHQIADRLGVSRSMVQRLLKAAS